MTIITKFFEFSTEKEGDIKNITEDIRKILKETNLNEGMILIFVVGATSAITTMEYEKGVINDFRNMLRRIAPDNINYEHNKLDDNGRSHVKASLLKPDLLVPFKDKDLILGTWQQIVFVELDTRPRKRKIVVQIMGE